MAARDQRERGVGDGAGVQGSAAISRRNGRRRKAEAAKLEQSDGVRAGVLAGQVWSVTARLSKRSRAARSLASARPCGPGRREPTRPQPLADRSGNAGSGHADPSRGREREAKGLFDAAVEVGPAACRAQRRAGANSAGTDVTERNAVQRRNDGDGADIIGAPLRAGHCTAQAVRPARPLFTGPQRPSGAQGGSRASVRSESAQSWRETCRLGQ